MPKADPYREWGDLIDDSVLLDCMRDFPRLIGISVCCDGDGQRCWAPYESDDDQFNARPVLYRTRAAAERALARMRREDDECGIEPPRNWGLTIWLAPAHEWSEVPSGKYLRMSGHRLPGTPRH